MFPVSAVSCSPDSKNFPIHVFLVSVYIQEYSVLCHLKGGKTNYNCNSQSNMLWSCYIPYGTGFFFGGGVISTPFICSEIFNSLLVLTSSKKHSSLWGLLSLWVHTWICYITVVILKANLFLPQLFFLLYYLGPRLSSFTTKNPITLNPQFHVNMNTAAQGSSPLLSPVLSDVGGARAEEEDEARRKVRQGEERVLTLFIMWFSVSLLNTYNETLWWPCCFKCFAQHYCMALPTMYY